MRLRYIIFKDAQHLKTKQQPDEMVAEVHLMKDGEKITKPWVEATPQQFAEYEASIAPIMLKWQKTQPYLVEVDGKRQEHFYIEGQLKPKPVLEKPNS